MKLTAAERLVIRNQLLIMRALKVPDYSESDLDEMIEVVQSGYEIFYPDLAAGLNVQGADPLVVKETMDILDMFRALDNAKRKGITPTGGRGHASYVGFDGNNDPHYGVAHFLITVQGKFTESAPHKNSHTSSTLPSYQRMLGVWKSLGGSHSLSQADVDAIMA